MCLIVSKSIQIAAEDIVCYKAVTKDLHSPCYGFEYQIEKLTPKVVMQELGGRVTTGYHTYKNKEDIDLRVLWNAKNNLETPYMRASIILECIIPKGTAYYEGYNNDFRTSPGYCSNQLLIKQII